MAYVTGTANSLADLLAAIQNACTANGWTLSSGGVLSKSMCFAELKIASGLITIRGGTGVDGSGNLTGACDTLTGYLGVAMSDVSQSPNVSPGFPYPVAYEVHIHALPDEIYVAVNYATSFFQIIGWGVSSRSGLTGSGTWYCGRRGGTIYNTVTSHGEVQSGGGAAITSLFAAWQSGDRCFGVDHKLDSATWNVEGAWRDWASLFFRQPNQWNQESILIPIRVYASRPSGYISPVLECAHARYVNIANLADQQVITLGTDKWKVYPWWARGSTVGIGTFTGVAGHAIRYDGP